MKLFSGFKADFQDFNILMKFACVLYFSIIFGAFLFFSFIGYSVIKGYFEGLESEEKERLAEIAEERSKLAEQQFQLENPCETTMRNPALARKLFEERSLVASKNNEQYPYRFFFPECEKRHQLRAQICKKQGSDLPCDSPEKKSELRSQYRRGCSFR